MKKFRKNHVNRIIGNIVSHSAYLKTLFMKGIIMVYCCGNSCQVCSQNSKHRQYNSNFEDAIGFQTGYQKAEFTELEIGVNYFKAYKIEGSSDEIFDGANGKGPFISLVGQLRANKFDTGFKIGYDFHKEYPGSIITWRFCPAFVKYFGQDTRLGGDFGFSIYGGYLYAGYYYSIFKKESSCPSNICIGCRLIINMASPKVIDFSFDL